MGVSQANLRNTPVDQRRLSAEDRQTYRVANPGGGRREMALKRARAYRGNLAYQNNRPVRTTDLKPGSGGVNTGRIIQQLRGREQAAEQRRQKGFKPERFTLPGDPASG